MFDPSNLHRDILDLSSTPPRRIGWRDINGAEAVMNGRGRYAFADDWNALSEDARTQWRAQFDPKPPQRPHNPGAHVFNAGDRMGHPTSADGKQGLQKSVWDLMPEDGGQPIKILMDWTVACEAVERGQGRYCFAEPGDATPRRAGAEAKR